MGASSTFKHNLGKLDYKDVTGLPNAKIKSNVRLEEQTKRLLVPLTENNKEVGMKIFDTMTTSAHTTREVRDNIMKYIRHTSAGIKKIAGENNMLSKSMDKKTQYRQRPLQRKKIIERLSTIDDTKHRYFDVNVIPELKKMYESDTQKKEYDEMIAKDFGSNLALEKKDDLKVFYRLYDKYLEQLKEQRREDKKVAHKHGYRDSVIRA